MLSRIDRALDELDLSDWLDQYVDVIKLSDTEIRIRPCPKCHDDRYKLYVNTDKRLFYCFPCGFGYGINDIFILMSAVSGIHLNDLKVKIAKTSAPSHPNDKIDEMIKDKIYFGSLNDENESFHIDPIIIPGKSILDNKGISSRQAKKYLIKRGLVINEIKENDLRIEARLNNIFGPFIVFPVYYYGIPVSWQGRRLVNKDPKYVSHENLNRWLWPLDTPRIKSLGKEVVLVEGVFDALGVRSMGYSALCTFGKKITSPQIGLLKRLNIEKVILAWDPEAVNDIIRGSEKLKLNFDVFTLNYSKKGEEWDPGDALNDPKARSFFDQLLKSPMNVRGDDYYRWQLISKWT